MLPLEICRPEPGPLWPVHKYGPDCHEYCSLLGDTSSLFTFLSWYIMSHFSSLLIAVCCFYWGCSGGCICMFLNHIIKVGLLNKGIYTKNINLNKMESGQWVMQFTVRALTVSLVLLCFLHSQQHSSMQPDKGRYRKIRGGCKRRTMTEL
jgi:hypothetical protein